MIESRTPGAPRTRPSRGWPVDGRPSLARVLALAIVALALAVPARGLAAEPAAAPRLQEVVVTVARLAPLEAAFVDVLHWEVLFRGALRDSEAAGWNLPARTRGRQLLLGSRGSDYGRIRLVELDGPDAGPMRPGSRWWDTGGAFSINLFVSDAQAVLDGLRARGWTTSLPLQTYEERSGERIVARGRYARMVGPGDFTLSFQQRDAPPLEKWPAFDGVSHVENVMEPVVELEGWTRVSAALLGMDPPAPTLRDISARPEAAASYGLPAALAAQARARQSILRIGPRREQMLTGWQFDVLRGADFAGQVDARHLGVLALRVVVSDVDAAARRLEAAAIPFVETAAPRALRPHGRVRSVVVRSGGGSGLLLEALQFEAPPR